MKNKTENIICVKFILGDKKLSKVKRIRETIYTNEKGEELSKVYTKMAPKGGHETIDPSTFTTKWDKGKTPEPRPKKQSSIRSKMLDLLCKLTKKSRKETRELVETNKISTSDYYKSAEEKKQSKRENKKIKNRRQLGKANSKHGDVTIQYNIKDERTGKVLETITKSFPSKGILRNNEVNAILKKYGDGSETISFKSKRGEKDRQRDVSEKARKEYKGSEKHLKKKAKLKEQLEQNANKSVEHSKDKGKTITKIKPLVGTSVPTKPEEIKRVDTSAIKKAA